MVDNTTAVDTNSTTMNRRKRSSKHLLIAIDTHSFLQPYKRALSKLRAQYHDVRYLFKGVIYLRYIFNIINVFDRYVGSVRNKTNLIKYTTGNFRKNEYSY